MGFDLNGVNPISKKGEYFRANVWWWRPLWKFVCVNCDDILNEKDQEKGQWNDWHEIIDKKANKIADRIYDLDKKGEIKKYEKKYKKEINDLEDGAFERHYPFERDFVMEFASFCEESGGFNIG